MVLIGQVSESKKSSALVVTFARGTSELDVLVSAPFNKSHKAREVEQDDKDKNQQNHH